MSFEMIIFLIIFVVIALLSFLTPLLQSHNIFFGVRIPEKMLERPGLKKLKRKYIRNFLFLSLIWLVLIGYIIFQHGLKNIEWAVLIWFAIAFIVYIYHNRQVKQWKSQTLKENPDLKSSNTARIIDTSYREEKLTIRKGWYVLPIFILISQIVLIITQFNRIKSSPDLRSDIIPTLIISFFLFLLIILQNYIINNAKQNISARNPKKSKIRNIIFRRRWSIFTFTALTSIISVFFIINLIHLDIVLWNIQFFNRLIVILAFAIVGASFTLSVLMGQSGSRINNGQKDSQTDYDDVDDDQHWKFGVFYYNPNDPSMFVEKRIGIGWTFNFANFKSILLGIALIVVILVLYIL